EAGWSAGGVQSVVRPALARFLFFWLAGRPPQTPFPVPCPRHERPRGVRPLLPRADEYSRAAGVPALHMAVRALHQCLGRGGPRRALRRRTGVVLPWLRAGGRATPRRVRALGRSACDAAHRRTHRRASRPLAHLMLRKPAAALRPAESARRRR